MSLKYTYHKDGSLPKHVNTVFVFGTNLAGRHGKGAAKVASSLYGAIRGLATGFTSPRSYGIPTKDFDLDILPLEHIRNSVNEFKSVTYSYPATRFFVSRIGCGLAKYSDSDIAPMFEGCNTNCSFAEEWKPFLG